MSESTESGTPGSSGTPAPQESGSPAQPPQGEGGERRRVVMQVDEAGKAPSYANAFQVQAGPAEVVLDLGYRSAAGQVNVPVEGGGTQAADRLRFLVGHRVALPYGVAKQLSITLGQAVQQAEQRAAGK